MIANSLRELNQLGRVIEDWELFVLMEVIRASAANTKTNTQLGASYSQNYETPCG